MRKLRTKSSYVSRELRGMSDVVITHSEPDLIVEIVALEMHSEGRLDLGYALSIVVAEPLDSFIPGPTGDSSENLQEARHLD